MNINTDTLVSMTETNQNFSKVARLVDEKGLLLL
jgi:antitoxin Phd